MMVPKVEFEIIGNEQMMKNINRFLSKKGHFDWSQTILNAYPELSEKLKEVSDDLKREEIANEFFKEYVEKNIEVLENAKTSFQEEWDKINDDALMMISEIVETGWPEDMDKIIARVSLNPICPRFLKQMVFDIYYKFGTDRMKATVLHECLHFIYFEKWKEVFADSKDEEFESPHLIWHLSEIVPKVILNDKRMQEIFDYTHSVYPIYDKLVIDERPILEIIQEVYDKKKDFADFLRKSYELVKANEKEILALK